MHEKDTDKKEGLHEKKPHTLRESGILLKFSEFLSFIEPN